ncbi:MAG: GNAT family N-acetyltransferase, partial [Gemmatimonadaceae bacterium]
MDVVDNQDRHRFETVIDGKYAIAEYRIDDKTMTLFHTLVPVELRGRGIAGTVVRAALDSARQRGLKVVPQCPYVAGFISKHP